MKSINIIKSLASVLLLLSTSLLAGAKTFYSAVTVNASGNGYVYASTSSSVDESSISYSSYTATHNSSIIIVSSTTHTYYLYAKGKPGSKFVGWTGDGESTDSPYKITVTASSQSSDSPTTASYTAIFQDTYLQVASTDDALGTVSISNPYNTEGDVVTLTAKYVLPEGSSEFSTSTKHSQAVTFEGWYNDAGELVSDQLSFSYTVKGIENFTARFVRDHSIKYDSNNKLYGYYRLETPFFPGYRYFLCMAGNYVLDLPTSVWDVISGDGSRYLYGALEFNQDNNWGNKDKKDVYAKTEAVFADPGCVFYLTGTVDPSNLYTTNSRTTVVSNIIASAQGATSDEIIEGKALNVKTAATPGYYILTHTVTGTFYSQDISLQLTYQRRLWLTSDKPDNSSYASAGDFDVQPVDREHIDQNYFGAYPDESMYYDGGYWTSMYTAFPYECYEEDGVEAYVVSSTQEMGGTNYVIIKKLEDGIVPAATPVLLKCKTTHVATNRLIPLEPDDSRLSSVEVGNNLLNGEYGLYSGYAGSGDSGAYGTGRATYDSSTMRVFGANANGQLGFFKLSANSDGSAKELIPNRAYLDLEQLTAPTGTSVAAASYRLAFDDLTGIDEVVVDGDELSQDAAKEYYNLQGQRVLEPVHGQVYIVRQGGKASKIRY